MPTLAHVSVVERYRNGRKGPITALPFSYSKTGKADVPQATRKQTSRSGQLCALIPDARSTKMASRKLPNLYLPRCLRDQHGVSTKLALFASECCFCQQQSSSQASLISERRRHNLVVLSAGKITCPKVLRPFDDLVQ